MSTGHGPVPTPEEPLWVIPADESEAGVRVGAPVRPRPRPNANGNAYVWAAVLGSIAAVLLVTLVLVGGAAVWYFASRADDPDLVRDWPPEERIEAPAIAEAEQPVRPEDLFRHLQPRAEFPPPEMVRPLIAPEMPPEPERQPEPPRPREPELPPPPGVREFVTFKAHDKNIVGLAVTPDGRTLATGTGHPPLFVEETGEVKLWDLETREEIHKFAGCGPLEFTPDGKFLFYFPNRNALEIAAAAVNGADDPVMSTTLRRRELATRSQLLGGPRASAASRWHNNIAFAPDGLTVLTLGSAQGGSALRLTDLKTLKELEVWPIKDGNVSSVAFAPDSRSFALVLGGNAEVRICEGATAETRRVLRGHAGEVHSLAYSRDGRRLATAGSDKTVRVWNPETGDTVAQLEGHTNAVLQVAFAPDGVLVASAGADGTVRLWDVKGHRQLGALRLPDGDDFTAHVAFAADGGALIGSRGGTVRIWDTRAIVGPVLLPPQVRKAPRPEAPAAKPAAVDPPKPEAPGPLAPPVKADATVRPKNSMPVGVNSYVHAVTFTPDGKDVVSVGDGGKVRRWRAATGEELPGAIDAHPRTSVLTVSLSGDGKSVATGSIDGTAKVWELETGRLVATAGRTKGFHIRAALSPDGKLLAAAGTEVTLTDVAANKHVAALPVPRSFIDALAFSPDGKLLAAGHKHGATVWDIATHQEAGTFGGHAGPVMSVAFAPDGATLVTASSDGTIKLWDLAKRAERRTLVGHLDPLSSVAFAPDGKLLVSGAGAIRFNPGHRGEVKLWDATTGKLLADLVGHTDGVSGVAFSSDGRTVASSSPGRDNTIKVWNVATFAGKPAEAKPAVEKDPPPAPKPVAEPARPDGGHAALAQEARQVLAKHCHRCHGQDGTAEGGFNFVLEPARMLARKLIVPNRPTDSRLLQRVRRVEMPPPEEKDELDDRQVATLNRWVLAGAPDFNPPREKRPLTTPLDVIQIIRDDLTKREGPDRHFSRYFTFTHLHNAGLSDDELQTHRHALSKLVNSLSHGSLIAVPRAIDADRTVYRISLRDYGWDTKAWEELVKVYPYRVEHDHEAADEVRIATRSPLAYLRGDWFVATASRPPLYYNLLKMPQTWVDLTSAQTGMQNIGWGPDEKVLEITLPHRAGFTDSGVSRSNRVLERWITRHGAFWQTFDFANNTGKKNVLAHPIDFEHDGQEVLFSLPNGLQAYAIFDAKGDRKDKGSTDVVSDPRRPDRAVEAGLSCMSCHVRGIIEKADQVRPHVEKNPRAFFGLPRLILEKYPPAADFDALLRKDAKRFQDAVRKTGAPLNRTEPIGTVAQRYEADLDLALAAAEVGTTPADFVKRCRESKDLTRVLGPLPDGGTVKRDVFIEAFGLLAKGKK